MQVNYSRRQTVDVKVGNLSMGSSFPIRMQSMLNTNTNDTMGSVQQALRIVERGGELVRLTTQGEKEAENLKNIKAQLRADGCDVPLVADVHFNAKVAFKAAESAEKVRINPGNFAQTFEDIQAKFPLLLALCKQNNVALRIGVNHGSLSKRMMAEYGDTPKGMVESCMEFLRLCKEHDFYNVVVSVKASNTRVMVQTVRLMASEMAKEDLNFPLHLGVTEAGDGEDGRIKSAIGIGTLLAEGLGDTIRVSLSEDPENEIEVCKDILSWLKEVSLAEQLPETAINFFSPYFYQRRETVAVEGIGGNNDMAVITLQEAIPEGVKVVELRTQNAVGEGRYQIAQIANAGSKSPVIVKRTYSPMSYEALALRAALDFGAFFIDGIADGIFIDAPFIETEKLKALSYTILQGARALQTKTEYISCPSCGRTLFDLQSTIKRIKEKTSHLKKLKIGIMGCIVNGPGEMADADYGYVGAGKNTISLYKGKECIQKNIPEEEAVDCLIALIKENGDWQDN